MGTYKIRYRKIAKYGAHLFFATILALMVCQSSIYAASSDGSEVRPECCGPNAVNMYPGEYTAPDGARLAPSTNPDAPYFDFRGNVTIQAGGCAINYPFTEDGSGLQEGKSITIGCALGDRLTNEAATEACVRLFNSVAQQAQDDATQGWSTVPIYKADIDACPLSQDQYALLPLILR